MRIRDLLVADSIQIGGSVSNKEDAIKKMVDLMVKQGNINDRDVYEKGVFAREEEGTTGIGEGIAIPHCKSDAVSKPGLAAMVLSDGVDYDALDGEVVDLIFLIAAPNTEDNVHLDVLSTLSTLLMDEKFQADLRAAKSAEDLLKVIDAAEADKAEADAAKEEVKNAAVVAVTACPTGIAHTYMAAEAIEKAGEALGVPVKVETRGSGGAKNVLTDEDIANATGVIVACDTKVPMDRFEGKPLLEVHVAEGINNAEELVTKASKGDAPKYVAKAGTKKTEEKKATGSIGHRAYTHLMSGVSHMLPFVIGGGILIAIAFLIDTIMGYGDIGDAFGSATPISALFKYIGGTIMGLMVPVLAGYIAYSIADRPGLAVGFLGGLLATNGNALVADYNWSNLGGFNKFVQNFAFMGENSGNTVSGFLGGIAAGFLAGAVVLLLKKICKNMPESLDGLKPMLIYPVVGTFIVGIIMCFILNPIIGIINTGLSVALTAVGNSGMIWLLGLILGGMMAIDMGGPINKAAYVFGTGMLTQAADYIAAGASSSDVKVQVCYIAMASVMVGGMVPPLGIALACQFFPKKFTEEEKKTKITNIIMGASFITEGAIPFAASDPGRVIPATLAGAGVAGLLSALFGCTLMAPHGGVFVFATVGNPLLYIVAWLVGSAVTCILLGILKKNAADR